MQPCRSQRNPFGKSVWLPLVACAALGVSGAYSAARADDRQDKTEVKVFVSDDSTVASKQGDAKLSDDDRKKLHAELDAILKERSKLDEKIRSLRGKLGERVQAHVMINGKAIDLSPDVLDGKIEARVKGFAVIDGKAQALALDSLPRIEASGKDGEKRMQLFLKDSGDSSDLLIIPRAETLNPGKDGEKRFELLLRDDLNGKDPFQSLSPELRQQIEKKMAEADAQMKRAAEKNPQLLREQTIILNSDKDPFVKGRVRILRSDSDSRIRELEKRIEALEKRLKIKSEGKSDDTLEQELF